jgi:uncharacterized OsmC-like protein
VTDEVLRALYDLRTGVLARHPELAGAQGQAFVLLADHGLGCHVDHEGGSLEVDLPAEEGGDARAPHPGQLMRAALGACLAQGYRIWAARLAVPIARVELALRCDFDARGAMDLDPGVAIGWQRVEIDVTVTSAAREADVRRVVEIANRLSPMLANLSRDVARRHRLTVITERSVPREVTPRE